MASVHNSVVDALSCKLPVYSIGVDGSGGFVSFPDGSVTTDATSDVTTPGASGAWFGLTYSAAVKRWLPVPTTWVSPDGVTYFFASPTRNQGNNPMFEVNGQTGTAAELGIAPLGYGWQVIAVTPGYVFARSLSFHSGVYVMPISSPYTNETFVTDAYWTAASGNYVYGSSAPDGGAIIRIDARMQSQGSPPIGSELWFNRSTSAQILGFDASGSPVIWTGTDMWIALAPATATQISSVPPLTLPTIDGSPDYGANAPVSDSHGLWFSTTDGIYLYAGGKTTKVSNLIAQVAGPCV